jgi:factor associated with neutral sphingomyelinase activation
LEPAEIYFEDFSAFLFPLDANKHEFEKKKQIGRLKVCSKSIVFDPKDMNKPLIKIRLKECIKISQWDGELATKYVTNSPCFMKIHIINFVHRNIYNEGHILALA